MEIENQDIVKTQTLNIKKLPLTFIHYKGFMPAVYSYDWHYPSFIRKTLYLQPKTMTMTLPLNFIHYKDFVPATYSYDWVMITYKLHWAHNVLTYSVHQK